MKKIYIILTLFFCVNINQAQYHPMPTKDAVWTIITGLNTNYRADIYGTSGDTLILDKIYTKIYLSPKNTNSFNPNNPDNLYKGSFREESKNLYFIIAGETSEQLFYDFSMNLGDTIFYDFSDICVPFDTWPNQFVPVLEEISSIVTIDNTSRDIYKFTPALSCSIGCYFREDWISGVGSTKGILFPLQFDFDCDSYFTILLCLEVDGKTVFRHPNYNNCSVPILNTAENKASDLNITPNPFVDKLYIDGVENIPSVKLYNQLGQQIEVELIKNRNGLEINTTNLSNGVYYLQVEDVFNQQKVVKCIKL
jgi:hypothetical protein